MRNELLCIIAAAVLAISGAAAKAAVTTFSTLPANGGLSWIGEGDWAYEATIGQTITVSHGYETLDSWSFWMQEVTWMREVCPDYVDFKAYVMAWDGAKATGGVLWVSDPYTTGGSALLQQFTFTPPGGLLLDPGTQYVLFISASECFDTDPGAVTFPFYTGPAGTGPGVAIPYSGQVDYDGGHYVVLRNGSNFSLLTSQAWESYGPADMGMTASFSGDGIVPAPEASLLAAIGSGFVAWLRWRKMLA